MLSLPRLMKVASAALAASIAASMSYGEYAVAAGPKGSGLLPPAEVFFPRARNDAPGVSRDVISEVLNAFAGMKLEEAKSRRTRALVDWLAELQTGDLAHFEVMRAEGGLVYRVDFRNPREGEKSSVFLAVPYGVEAPYAVTLRSIADGAMTIESQSCELEARRDELAAHVPGEVAEYQALDHVSAYLRRPVLADPLLPADCLTSLLDAG